MLFHDLPITAYTENVTASDVCHHLLDSIVLLYARGYVLCIAIVVGLAILNDQSVASGHLYGVSSCGTVPLVAADKGVRGDMNFSFNCGTLPPEELK